MQSLESFKKSNKHVFRQNLLRELLSSHASQSSEKLFNDYQIPIEPNGSLLLIMLKLDRYASFCSTYTKRDQSLLMYALMNMTEEILIQEYKCACVDMGNDHVIIIVNTEKPVPESDEWAGLARGIQKRYAEYCTLSVSAFVSETVNSILEIRTLYEELLLLSRYRLRYGHGCVLQTSNLPVNRAEEPRLDEPLEQLTEAIRRGRLEDMRQNFNDIVNMLKDAGFNEMMFALSMLTASVFQTLALLEKHSRLSFDLDYITVDQKIKTLETLEEIKDEFFTIFAIITSRMNQNKDDRVAGLVEKTVKYIELHCKDKALSTALRNINWRKPKRF